MREGSFDSINDRSHINIAHKMSIVTNMGNVDLENSEDLECEGNSN